MVVNAGGDVGSSWASVALVKPKSKHASARAKIWPALPSRSDSAWDTRVILMGKWYPVPCLGTSDSFCSIETGDWNSAQPARSPDVGQGSSIQTNGWLNWVGNS